MRRLVVFLGVLVTMAFVACANKSDNTVSTTSNQCGTGQILDSQGRCLNHGYCQYANQGVDPTTGQCVDGTLVNGNYQDIRFENSLSITNSSVFIQLVKDAQNTCSYWFWGISFTSYSSLTSSSYLDLSVPSVDSTNVTMSLGVGANAPDAIPGPPLVMTFSGQAYPVNTTDTANGPGLELQGNGAMGSCTWNAVGNNGLVVKVPHQTFKSPYMDATLYYKGTQFARARLYAY